MGDNNLKEQSRLVRRMNKSCDQCRLRKVRCIIPEFPGNTEDQSTCIHCINRNEDCQFSPIKRKFIRKNTLSTPSLNQSLSPSGYMLPIDYLLKAEPQETSPSEDFQGSSVKKSGNNAITSTGSSSSIPVSFFSAQRMTSLANRLGSPVLTELVQDLEDVLISEVCSNNISSVKFGFQPPQYSISLESKESSQYTNAYFENIHPLYPFLDEQEFISHTTVCHHIRISNCSKVCSAIYHAVLAMGSQHCGGGDLRPGTGTAWKLFQVSLGLIPDILVPPYSLRKLQALIAMSIFAMSPCCIHLDQSLINEAASMAHKLRYHKDPDLQPPQLRAFWTIYYLEKFASFIDNNSSMFSDEDISCELPFVNTRAFGNYNWFLSAIRLARLTSIAYTSLFTKASLMSSQTKRLSCVKDMRNRLEEWRLSVPTNFRPKEPLRSDELEQRTRRIVTTMTHYWYYNLVFAVERVSLHIEPESLLLESEERKVELKHAARNVIGLLQCIEVDPCIPVFILGMIPLSATFILFDFVIHNPDHDTTQDNLALLDRAAEFFSQIDYYSEGALPGKIISRFAGIARQYALKFRGGDPRAIPPKADMQQGVIPIWDYAPNIDFSDVNFSSVDMHSNCAAPDPGTRFTSTTSAIQRQALNYSTAIGTSGNLQMPEDQIEELKSIFGFVFPNQEGDI